MLQNQNLKISFTLLSELVRALLSHDL